MNPKTKKKKLAYSYSIYFKSKLECLVYISSSEINYYKKQGSHTQKLISFALKGLNMAYMAYEH